VASGFRDVEYLELRAADDLAALDRASRPSRLLVAAWMGDVRLIDNVAVAQAR
jgi:pantoate--beta-alanine ligase